MLAGHIPCDPVDLRHELNASLANLHRTALREVTTTPARQDGLIYFRHRLSIAIHLQAAPRTEYHLPSSPRQTTSVIVLNPTTCTLTRKLQTPSAR